MVARPGVAAVKDKLVVELSGWDNNTWRSGELVQGGLRSVSPRRAGDRQSWLAISSGPGPLRPAMSDNPPIEFAFPDLRRWEKGAAPYIHVLESGKPGPTVMVAALTHGNEVSGAIVVDALLAAGLKPRKGTLIFSFNNIEAYHSFDAKNALQVAHDRRGFQSHLGPARPAGDHARDPAGAGGEALRRTRRLPARPSFHA